MHHIYNFIAKSGVKQRIALNPIMINLPDMYIVNPKSCLAALPCIRIRLRTRIIYFFQAITYMISENKPTILSFLPSKSSGNCIQQSHLSCAYSKISPSWSWSCHAIISLLPMININREHSTDTILSRWNTFYFLKANVHWEFPLSLHGKWRCIGSRWVLLLTFTLL